MQVLLIRNVSSILHKKPYIYRMGIMNENFMDKT